MSSPFPTLFMVVGYLYTVLILGPTVMDNRKPFKLREILIVYNAAQVIYSAAMFYEVRKQLVLERYNLRTRLIFAYFARVEEVKACNKISTQ
jgi:GNS1/SUR4 family